MIISRSIPLPRHRVVSVATSALPVAVRVSTRTLDQVAQGISDQQLADVAAAARAEGRAEAIAGACTALQEAADRLDAAREQAEDALAGDAIHLAVEIARQILKIEIAARNYDLETIVRATLAASEIKRGHCIVNLHPDDADAVSQVAFRGETEISANADVPLGAVHIETPRGLLVRDPDAALEEIREQLLEDLA